MLDQLLDANRRFAARFAPGDATARPRRRVAVVTCMDCRIDPAALFGLEIGDAVVVRNAGGRVTEDVLRSLGLATRLLGVEEVVVMHHSDCALADRGEDAVRRQLEEAGAAVDPSWEFLAMPDPDSSLRDDVAAVRRCSLLPSAVEVVGLRYDVSSGGVSVLTVPEED